MSEGATEFERGLVRNLLTQVYRLRTFHTLHTSHTSHTFHTSQGLVRNPLGAETHSSRVRHTVWSSFDCASHVALAAITTQVSDFAQDAHGPTSHAPSTDSKRLGRSAGESDEALGGNQTSGTYESSQSLGALTGVLAYESEKKGSSGQCVEGSARGSDGSRGMSEGRGSSNKWKKAHRLSFELGMDGMKELQFKNALETVLAQLLECALPPQEE